MQTVRNERGSVIVFVTLMIVLLMVMVGLGLDTGHLTYARNQGQGAVDAAALAAVTGLPSRNDTLVKNRAAGFNSNNTYVGSNTNPIGTDDVSYVQYDFATGTITYGANVNTANGVRVALESGSSVKTPTFLTPLFNLMGISMSQTKNINVSAVATITSMPAIPIAMWSNMCPQYPGPYVNSSLTKNIDIKMQHPDQKADGNENSCWTTFLDCSSGAADVKAGFQTAQQCSGSPINGDIGIGTPICQNRGQVNTVLGAADDFFSANGMPDSWWVVPVLGGGGNCDPANPTPIVTWAKIRPIAIVKTGDPKYITAEIGCGDDIIKELDVSLCFRHRLVREKAKNM